MVTELNCEVWSCRTGREQCDQYLYRRTTNCTVSDWWTPGLAARVCHIYLCKKGPKNWEGWRDRRILHTYLGICQSLHSTTIWFPGSLNICHPGAARATGLRAMAKWGRRKAVGAQRCGGTQSQHKTLRTQQGMMIFCIALTYILTYFDWESQRLPMSRSYSIHLDTDLTNLTMPLFDAFCIFMSDWCDWCETPSKHDKHINCGSVGTSRNWVAQIRADSRTGRTRGSRYLARCGLDLDSWPPLSLHYHYHYFTRIMNNLIQ